MPQSYTDGDILSDSFKTFIKGETYIVNSFTPTNPSVEIARNGIEGATAAQRFVQNVNTASVEFQINTEDQNQRLKFAEFIVPAGFGFGAEYEIWVIIEESQNITSGGVRTRTCTCRKVLNPVDIMVVEGAGTEAADGVYLRDGKNLLGFPKYKKTGATDTIARGPAAWFITVSPTSLYSSSEDVATPDLVKKWTVFDGEPPAPTVRRGTRNDL